MNGDLRNRREAEESGVKSKDVFVLLLALLVPISLALFRIHVSEPHADVGVVQGVFEPTWSKFMLDFFNSEGIYGGTYPPLYHLVAKAYGTVFGTSIVHLRVLSVIAFAGLVFLSWYSYPLLTKSRDTRLRLWFTLAVGMSPAHIWWAQTAKYTMWLYLLYAASIVAALRLVQNRSLQSAIVSSLAVCAVIYTHYVGFFFAAAHFCALGLLSAWRRDRILIRRVLLSAVLVSMLTAPLLPTVYQANKLREQEGYSSTYNKLTELGNIIHGIVITWNFGYSLVPEHRTQANVSKLLESIWEGDFIEAFSTLRYAFLPFCAAIVLGISVFHAARHVLQSKSSRVNAAYIIIVSLLTFIFSLTKGMSDVFMYFGFGTWCTLALLAIGCGSCKGFKIPLLLGSCILLLFAVSLWKYYQLIDCKYPGARLVTEYLNDHKSNFKLALVDDWILSVRGTPLHRNELPSDISVHVVPSVSSISLELLTNSETVAFFGGNLESIQSSLTEKKADHPGFSWVLVQSWESLERPGRSIHVFRLHYAPQ